MTVEYEYPRNTFNLVSQTEVQLDFYVENKENILVVLGGIIVSPLEYTVTQLKSYQGARVVFNAPINGSLVVSRYTRTDRSFNYNNTQNNIKPESLNNDFDRIWRSQQEQDVALAVEIAGRKEADEGIYEYVNSLAYPDGRAGLVSYQIPQVLTEAEKFIAQTNIGAISGQRLDELELAIIQEAINRTDGDNTLGIVKQDTLVSGDNIKTLNGESLLGSGDIQIDGFVSYEVNQNLNSLYQEIARNNIDAASTDQINETNAAIIQEAINRTDGDNALALAISKRLRFDASQTLSPAEQTQLRTNMGDAAGLMYLTDIGPGSTATSQVLRPKQAPTGASGGSLTLAGSAATSGVSSSYYGFSLNHKLNSSVGVGSLDLQTTRNITTSPDYNVSGQFSVGLGKGLKVAGNNNIVFGSMINEFVQTVSGTRNIIGVTQANFTSGSYTTTGSNNIILNSQSGATASGSGNLILGGRLGSASGDFNTILGAYQACNPSGQFNVFLGNGSDNASATSGQYLVCPYQILGDLDLGVTALRVGNFSEGIPNGEGGINGRRMNRKELNYLLVQNNPVSGTTYNASSNLAAASSTNTLPMRNCVVEGYIRTTVVSTASSTMQKMAVYKFEGTYYNGSLNYTLTQMDTTAGGDTSGLIPVTLSIVSNTLRISIVNNDSTTTGTGFTLRLAAYVCAQDLNPDASNV